MSRPSRQRPAVTPVEEPLCVSLHRLAEWTVVPPLAFAMFVVKAFFDATRPNSGGHT